MLKKYFIIFSILVILLTSLVSILALNSPADAQPSFIFNLNISQKVFVIGDSFDVYYQSDVENPEISASITYPDGSIQKINSFNEINISQFGTYELEVTASKEGYEPVITKEKFEVVGNYTVLEYQAGEIPQLNNPMIYIVIIVIMSIVLVGLIVYYIKLGNGEKIDN